MIIHRHGQKLLLENILDMQSTHTISLHSVEFMHHTVSTILVFIKVWYMMSFYYALLKVLLNCWNQRYNYVKSGINVFVIL